MAEFEEFGPAEDPGELPESLRGSLLIASPALVDPNFARTVVLITEHGADGAMGVVLNRPSEIEVGDVAPELGEIAEGEPVFIGGPVQPQALVVLAEFNRVEAAAWIVVDDVGFVAAETEYAELRSWSGGAGSTRVTRAGARVSSRASSPRRPGSSSARARPSCSPTTPRPCGGTCSRARAGSSR